MLTLSFWGADGLMITPETLTSGMVGAKIAFQFSEDWECLNKTAVFMAGNTIRAVSNVEDAAEIPADVLAAPGSRLYVGIYGESEDGTLVIPTICVAGPKIQYGADPLQAPAGEPPVTSYARLLTMIGDLTELKTEAKDSLVAALNEMFTNGSGGNSGSDSTQNAVLSETEKTLILRLFNKAAYNNAGMLDTYNELATLWSGSTEEPGGSEGGGDSGGDGETTIPATGIVLSADTLTFDSITSQLLIATVTPVNTTDKVVWTSSDQSVATVSGGAVKSVGDGSCAITATAGPVSASCNVTVALPAVDGYENGYLNDSGVLTGSKTDFVSTAYKDVTPGDTIIVAVGGADIATVRTIRINEYDANKNFVKRQYESTNSYKEFTLDATTEFVRVGFGVNVTDTESLDSLFANYSLFRSSEVSQRAIDLTAEIGNLSITDGIETDGNDRLRTDFVEGVSFVVYSSPVTLSRSAARKYDSNKALTTAAADTKYVRILLVAEAEDSPNDIFGTILFINGNFYRVVEG